MSVDYGDDALQSWSKYLRDLQKINENTTSMKTQLSAEFVMALIILFSICYCQHFHFGRVVGNPFSIPIISDVSFRFCIFSRSTTSKATGKFCFFRFNCNKGKLFSTVKQSQNILIMIVAKMFWKNFTIYRFLVGSNVASASSSRHEEQKGYPLLNGEHMFKHPSPVLPTWKKSGFL